MLCIHTSCLHPKISVAAPANKSCRCVLLLLRACCMLLLHITWRRGFNICRSGHVHFYRNRSAPSFVNVAIAHRRVFGASGVSQTLSHPVMPLCCHPGRGCSRRWRCPTVPQHHQSNAQSNYPHVGSNVRRLLFVLLVLVALLVLVLVVVLVLLPCKSVYV